MAENNNNQQSEPQQNFFNHTAYKGGFILTPEIKPRHQRTNFPHITKDFAMTNFRLDPKTGVNEPYKMECMLKSFHPLTKPEYFETIKTKRMVYVEDREYEAKVLDNEGNEQIVVIKTPVFKEEEIEEEESLFPKTYHLKESEVISMVEITGSTNAHRMKSAITDRHEKEESVQDKTEVKPTGWFGGRSQSGERR